MYQIPELKKFSNLVHAFSTKKEGNMSFSWGPEKIVLENRKRFLSQLNIELDLCIFLDLEHKNKIVTADQSFIKEKAMVVADGAITKEKNLYLFMSIADCLPLILFDPVEKIIGLAHAGWKSTEEKIAPKIVQKMIRESNCNLLNIYVGIGPAIHKKSFKFKNPIQEKLLGWEPFLKNLSNGETIIDLIGYNKKQLEDAGIFSQNIYISDIDTAKNPNFFSHYRDSRENPKNEGRFACVVGIRQLR